MTPQELTPVVFVDQTGQLGGAEMWLLDLVVQRAAKDRVLLFESGPFEDRLREAGASAEVLGAGAAISVRKNDGVFKQFSAIKRVASLANQLASTAGDCLLYANTPKAMAVSALAKRRSGGRLIYHLHDILDREHFSFANRRLLVFLANRYANRVVANSRHTADAFAAAGGNRRLVDVVYNGIDHQPHDEAIGQREDVREGLRSEQGAGDRPVVAVFGRLSEWKGQHVAVEAIRQLPDAHLWLVGDALFGEDDYATRLRSLISESGLEDRVRLPGFRSDIPQLMQAADVVVHCSTAPEPFGRVIVEAMMAGRPVVATDAGGAKEILQDGELGHLTAPGDAADLAATLRGLLENSQEAEELGARGRDSARRRFNLGDRSAEINEIIEATA